MGCLESVACRVHAEGCSRPRSLSAGDSPNSPDVERQQDFANAMTSVALLREQSKTWFKLTMQFSQSVLSRGPESAAATAEKKPVENKTAEKKLSENGKKQEGKPRTCYNCQEEGHISRDCKKPRQDQQHRKRPQQQRDHSFDRSGKHGRMDHGPPRGGPGHMDGPQRGPPGPGSVV